MWYGFREAVAHQLTIVCRYGMVLAKEKNEELALYWLVRSVHLFPMNWGCWQEMTALISRVEDVGHYSAHILAIKSL